VFWLKSAEPLDSPPQMEHRRPDKIHGELNKEPDEHLGSRQRRGNSIAKTPQCDFN
jgi:hypothetical protein